MSAAPYPELERALAAVREHGERERFARFDDRTLAWLALLPEWDDALAVDVRLATDRTVPDLIRDLTEARLIESRAASAPDGTDRMVFWARDGVRADIGRYLRNADRHLRDLAAALPLSRVSVEWLDVAETARGGRVHLVDRVDALLAEGREREAMRTVAAMRVIGEVLGQPLADTARRAQWRLDRAAREARDRRALRHYTRQPAVESALDDLLRDDPGQDGTGPWALHLLGAGGVGKTMTVRYLASGRYAADRRTPAFPVARVDFDHLDPRYPERHPAELFLALAAELRAYGRGRADEYANRAMVDAGTSLHEELARAEPDRSRVSTLLREVTDAFAALLRGLGPRVVLVLDTCEELTKLYAPGASAPAIDRTFAMLEALHTGCPGLRVLLAGRRWLVPPSGEPARAAGLPRLSERPYVRVLRTDGFGGAEAREYVRARGITEVRRFDVPVNPGSAITFIERPNPLFDAILSRVCQSTMTGNRYNPFELAGYCEWALSEPDLTVERLSSGGDPYVQQRIIGRISAPAVRAALPAAIALGRFDRDMITPALRRAKAAPGMAFDGLASQEWVETVSTYEHSGLPRVIEVDEHLRERIHRVLIEDPAWSPADEAALGRDARAVLEGATALADVTTETVETAVRLLPAEAAGAMWARLEDRILRDDEWAWAASVTERVAAVAAAPDDGPTILAAIRATQAASRVHLRQRHDLADLWLDAERWSPHHPDPELRQVLHGRALLGRVAAGDVDLTLPDERLLRAAPAGSVIAAAEALMGTGSPLAADIAEALASKLRSNPDDPALHAGIWICHTVRNLTSGDLASARTAGDRAVTWALRADGMAPTAWADWLPPRDVPSRARLARLVVAARSGEEPGDSPVPEIFRRVRDDVDAERYLALWIRVALGFGPVPVDAYPDGVSRGTLSERPTHWLHHQVGPLAVELAEAHGVAGQPDHAERILRDRLDAAVVAADDPDTVEQCQLALLRLCRRHRTLAFEPTAPQLARESTPAVRAEARETLALTDGSVPPPDDAAADDPILAAYLAHPDDMRDHLPPMSPGAFGRAALRSGELLALTRPADAISLLTHAADALAEAEDGFGAAQATLVAALATARGGHARGVEPLMRRLDALGVDQVSRDGWQLRLEVLRSYPRHRPLPVGIDSLEVRLARAPASPGAAPTPPSPGAAPAPLSPRAAPVRLSVASVSFSAWLRRGFAVLRRRDQSETWTASLVRIAEGYGHSAHVTVWRARAELTVPRRFRPERPHTWLRWLGSAQAVQAIDVDMTRPELRLAALGPAPRPDRHMGPLEVDFAFDERPWEQWLDRALPADTPDRPLWFRRSEGDPRSKRPAWREQGSYIGPEYLARAVPPGARDGRPRTDARTAHLVGNPFRISSGLWYFRVRDGGTYGGRPAPGQRVAADESLIGAGALDAALVVFQAEPADGPPEPLGAQRHAFAGVAGTAFSAGAEAVIVVPRLPDTLAAEVIAEVWAWGEQKRWSPSTATCLRLLARLRAMVAGASAPAASPGADRPDLDVLLYLRTPDLTSHG